jgi:hypothetical protein
MEKKKEPFDITIFRVYHQTEPDVQYVGRARKKLEYVFHDLKKDLLTGRKRAKTHFLRTMAEKGVDNFRIETLETVRCATNEDAQKKHQEWLDKLKPSLNQNRRAYNSLDNYLGKPKQKKAVEEKRATLKARNQRRNKKKTEKRKEKRKWTQQERAEKRAKLTETIQKLAVMHDSHSTTDESLLADKAPVEATPTVPRDVHVFTPGASQSIPLSLEVFVQFLD